MSYKVVWRGQFSKFGTFLGGLVMLLLTAVACRGEQSTPSELQGRIILWHDWSAEEELVLVQALNDFLEVNPGVEITRLAIPPETILAEFEHAVAEGLGPDLIIGASDWIRSLAAQSYLRPVESIGINQRNYPGRIEQAVQYRDVLYGVPGFLEPQALYFNRQQVSIPAANLDELLLQTADGRQIGFVPRFQPAYWGIRTFGEGLFDAEGNFTLATSGFTEWLTWLAANQNDPNIILSVDDASLLELFAQGQITYFIAGPEKQAELKRRLGVDKLGVTILPSGPAGAAAPLLPIESMLLNGYSSANQTMIAETLAEYLTNQQQSIRFMRDLDRVPANPSAGVDSRLYPTVDGFARQAFTGVTLPDQINLQAITESGDRAYANVLSGTLTPEEAVCRFGLEIVAATDFSGVKVDLPEGCEPFVEP